MADCQRLLPRPSRLVFLWVPLGIPGRMRLSSRATFHYTARLVVLPHPRPITQVDNLSARALVTEALL